MIHIPFFGNTHDDVPNGPKDPTTAGANADTPAAAEHPLDARTGGIFSAPTSGERAAKVRAWLATEPDPAAMQEVYKELSLRDKGAAKALREKLDDIKRSKGQEALAAEWAARAEALLQASRFNIADAMAWQRDAAKAGAPLSREPLLALKNQLTESVQRIEDLHTRTQVQREAAALLAQRIELLSTKSWRDAEAVQASLQADIQHWHAQTLQLQQDTHWQHVDVRHSNQLDSARQQLHLVAQAFTDALAQAHAAAVDSSQPLPPVQIWADELRAARGETAPAAPASGTVPATESAADNAAAQARQNEATEAIQPLLQTLDKELANGHSKTATAAAQALRHALKEHGRFVPTALDAQVQAALTKASELEGWQRWRADQLRTELVQKAEALIHRPAATTEATEAPATSASIDTPTEQASVSAGTTEKIADNAAEKGAAEPAQASPAETDSAQAESSKTELPTSPHSPRKLQDMLRQLREQWKEVDQGGVPNHALWRRFDQACNEAYRIVQAWLAHMKQQAAEQKGLRLALLTEVKAWGEALAARSAQAADAIDWKAVHRELGEFSRRWREAGHVSEKVFAELQPQWKAALQQATKPLEAVQQASLAIRQQLIEQAQALSSGEWRIDAIKELQHRWQQEAQRISLERRQEQKLWDTFRKPIDAAFQRRIQQREQLASSANQRDQAVLQAVQALDSAVAGSDAQAIRAAMQHLEAAMHAQQTAQAAPGTAHELAPAGQTPAQAASAEVDSNTAPGAAATEAAPAEEASPAAEEANSVAEKTVAATPRPVVAMRGDDRPGARVATSAPAKQAGRPERDARRTPARDGAGSRREGKRPLREDNRSPRPQTPRVGDAAFRAQRAAVERAQTALRTLAAQAHGETLVQILSAWEQRAADVLPPANALGKTLGNTQRNLWVQALSSATASAQRLPVNEALLRLEMAANAPTPAEHLDARRTLQLQLLTRRNDPAPAETWPEDVAHVLATPYDAMQATRLQNALRLLLKR